MDINTLQYDSSNINSVMVKHINPPRRNLVFPVRRSNALGVRQIVAPTHTPDVAINGINPMTKNPPIITVETIAVV